MRQRMAPRWLTEGEGGLVGYALDVVKDAFMDRAYRGLLARFPQNDANGTPGVTDALTAMGRDRRVVRGIDESDTDYAARLVTWLDDRRTAGNPYTLMRVLHAYTGTADGVSFRTVDVNGNWYSRAADGTETASLGTGNWLWDSDTDRWSRFWVIIYPGTLWEDEDVWGTGVYGDTSGTIGSTVTPEQAATLRAIVADWKPQGTRGDVILALDPSSFDPTTPEPDGLWGKWYKYVFGDAVESRLTTGRYSGA